MVALARPDTIASPAARDDAPTAAAHCYAWAGRALPWCWAVAGVALLLGMALGLALAPQDFLQGDAYRIVFVHVPAAAMSMLLYAALALCAIVALAGGRVLPALATRALAPTGALMSFLALWTGALWARPVRGLWWAWDARFVAELLLLALFVAMTVLHAAFDDPRRGERAAARLALVALLPLVLLPWWVQALGTGPSLHALGAAPAPPSDGAVRWGLALMTAAFVAWSMAAVLHRLRSILLEHERGADWARGLAEARP
jgi:heme exporter protein C